MLHRHIKCQWQWHNAEFERSLQNIWVTRTCSTPSQYQFSPELKEEKGVDAFVLHPSALGVWCSVWLFQLSWKKLLGNRNGHRPGSLSGKWNPESGSQTSNHTFILFIHSHSGALPEKPEGGAQKWIQVCVLRNHHAYKGAELTFAKLRMELPC